MGDSISSNHLAFLKRILLWMFRLPLGLSTSPACMKIKPESVSIVPVDIDYYSTVEVNNGSDDLYLLRNRKVIIGKRIRQFIALTNLTTSDQTRIRLAPFKSGPRCCKTVSDLLTAVGQSSPGSPQSDCPHVLAAPAVSLLPFRITF